MILNTLTPYEEIMNNQPKQYTNTNPPYLNKDWQYNQYNSILDRFKAMGWVAPSEQKGIK
jgi:hypothetical protein